MGKALAIQQDLSAIESVLMRGDLSRLTEPQRLEYFQQVCKTVGLNPLTKPFEYITMDGKQVLYANKGCAEQLRMIHKISVRVISRDTLSDLFVVTSESSTPDGRTDSSIGAVSIAGLKGKDLANAMMKAETKSKRRATFSICGLNILDETEVESEVVSSHPNSAISTPTQLGLAPGVDPKKPTDSRKELGAEIVTFGKKLDLNTKQIGEWAMEVIKKPLKEMSIEDMERFLTTIKEECGRNGIFV